MAIGRRVMGPVRYVSVHDDAVDPDVHTEFVASRFDPAKLKLKNGVQPTWFVLRQLTHGQLEQREYFPEGAARNAVTVRCGLAGVENYLVLKPDGEVDALRPVTREQSASLGSVVSEAWMDEANLGPELMVELATMINAISVPRGPLSKLSGPLFGDTESPGEASETGPQ